MTTTTPLPLGHIVATPGALKALEAEGENPRGRCAGAR